MSDHKLPDGVKIVKKVHADGSIELTMVHPEEKSLPAKKTSQDE